MAFRVDLIATEIKPSDGGIDSYRDCNRVDRVLDDFDSGRVGPGQIYFENFLWSRCLLHVVITLALLLKPLQRN